MSMSQKEGVGRGGEGGREGGREGGLYVMYVPAAASFSCFFRASSALMASMVLLSLLLLAAGGGNVESWCCLGWGREREGGREE